MGKRVVKWVLNEMILGVAKALEDPKSPVVIEAEFNLEDLKKVMTSNSDFEKQCLAYLAKQKMMDTGASLDDPIGKISAAKKKWGELLAGKWEGERVNGTGAAESKKTVNAVKEASKAITLQGLMLKQVMAGFPGNEPFTEADQVKLDEFIQIAAQATAGKKAKN